jgi:FkbM family methyltransferase
VVDEAKPAGGRHLNYRDRIRDRFALWRGSRGALAVLCDSLHARKSVYLARNLDGLALSLLPGRGEWFTFYENLVRQDYLRGLAALAEGDRVVDIGANIGAFTVLAASKVGRTGRVFAFEPDPATCERLRGNVRLNGLENVVVENCAVGAAAGEATFYRHAKNAYSSLMDGVDGRVQEHLESFPVPVRGIREVIAEAGPAIKLLKVDCEGSEYDIVDALDAAAAAAVQQISMEVHPVAGRSAEGLQARIESWGMRVTFTNLLMAMRK